MSRVSGVAEQLRLMLLRGEVAAGELLVEPELKERLRVGRFMLREAMRRLEGEGLLVANDSGGLRAISLDRDDLTATLQVRATLEALSAGLAAERFRLGRAPGSGLAELAALADAAAEQSLVADRHFHRAVAVLGGNQPSRDALNRVWDRMAMAAANGVPGAQRLTAAEGDHHELVAAIAAGDDAAASAIAARHALAALR
jgi:DNA-binding GntR family transcriptional regulator